MELIISFFLAVLASLIAMDFRNLEPNISDWVLRFLSRTFAKNDRDTKLEEWRSIIVDYEPGLVRFIQACSFICVPLADLTEEVVTSYRIILNVGVFRFMNTSLYFRSIQIQIKNNSNKERLPLINGLRYSQ